MNLPSGADAHKNRELILAAAEECGTPGCNAITEEGHRLLQRGQEAGAIRRDVTYEDFIYVVTAISIAVEKDGLSKLRIGHLVDLFLNGISVKGSN
jgi:hypothetical protein